MAAAALNRRDIEGRLVFITGGASGIGLGMARAFAAEGACVALADVQTDAAEAAARTLVAQGARALAVPLDVRDAAAWRGALNSAERAFGPLIVLCSNAGVAGSRNRLEDTGQAAWDWTLGVNLGGAFNAINEAVPRLRAHGRPGRVVLTASMGAFLVRPGNGVYSASKAAIVALAEALRGELAGSRIGVTVLCPGLVNTRLLDDNATRGPEGVDLGEHEPETEAALRAGLDPLEVGRAVVRAAREDRFWLFTHPELGAEVDKRFAEIRDAMV
jgi:NAD(P)-dependent dehydrogenase (short-subunit alcohol dehydrogenase family)